MTNPVRQLSNKVPTYLSPTSEKPILAHYTGYPALLGIVQNKELWATNIRYLNDSREFIHGLEILSRTVARSLSLHGSKKIYVDFSSEVQERIHGRKNANIHVASFTEDPDRLSQWRGYSAGGGVSIGFCFDHLKKVAKNTEFKLFKCVYDYEEKEDIARFVFEENYLEELDGPNLTKKDIEGLAWGLITAFSKLAACFKDPGFEEEAEWRLVSDAIPGDSANVSFRTTRSLLIPFYKLSLDIKQVGDRGRQNIGIDQIVISPTNKDELMEAAVSTLFLRHNIDWGSIGPSRIPYRSL